MFVILAPVDVTFSIR